MTDDAYPPAYPVAYKTPTGISSPYRNVGPTNRWRDYQKAERRIEQAKAAPPPKVHKPVARPVPPPQIAASIAYEGFRTYTLNEDRRMRDQFPPWDELPEHYRAAWKAAARAAKLHYDEIVKKDIEADCVRRFKQQYSTSTRIGQAHSLTLRFVYPSDLERQDDPAMKDQLSRVMSLTPASELEEFSYLPSPSANRRGRPRKRPV